MVRDFEILSCQRQTSCLSYLFRKYLSANADSEIDCSPGVCEMKSERRIRAEYPEEVAKHEQDPYHHRYPRAEVRMSLLELNGK